MTTTHHIPWNQLPRTYTTTPTTTHPNPTPCIIRHPTPADATSLYHFASATFNDTINNHRKNTPENVQLYNTATFSPDLQLAEINSPNLTIILCELAKTHDIIGYVQLKHNHTEPCCIGAQPSVEIQRIYIDKQYHGVGIAQELYALTIRYITTVQHCKSVWLGVSHFNDRAQRFYSKLGFKLVGEHLFMFGNDQQTDDIMELDLTTNQPATTQQPPIQSEQPAGQADAKLQLPLTATATDKQTGTAIQYTIRPAAPSDVAALTALGRRTFLDAHIPLFKHLCSDDYLQSWADGKFSDKVQSAQIADPNTTILLVDVDDTHQLAGYVMLLTGVDDTDEVVRKLPPPYVDLNKFYVLSTYHGFGIAQRLFAVAKQYAIQTLHCATLWLQVSDNNERAVRFYERCGMLQAGRWMMMNGFAVDIVYTLSLKSTNAHSNGTSATNGTEHIKTSHIPSPDLPQTFTTTDKPHAPSIQYTIRHPTVDDTGKLSQLAYRTFYDTHLPLAEKTSNIAGLRTYCDTAYTADIVAAYITSNEYTIIVCETTTTHELIAYLLLRHNRTEPCCSRAQPNIELFKVYLLKQYQGTGLAYHLLATAIKYVQTSLGCRSIWLGVGEHNKHAMQFYEKLGFQHVGHHKYENTEYTDMVYELIFVDDSLSTVPLKNNGASDIHTTTVKTYHKSSPDLPQMLMTANKPHAPSVQYTIRHPINDDAETLSQLVYRTFYDTYLPRATQQDYVAQLTAYCDTEYTPEKLGGNINNKEITMLVCELNSTKQLIAYVLLRHNRTEPCCSPAQPNIELFKIYSLKQYQGTGLAYQLLDATVRYVKDTLGCCSMWLGVSGHNTHATQFYEKRGFKHVGQHKYEDTDFVDMVYELVF